MAEYLYTNNPGNLKKIFQKIPELGVPAKFVARYLGQIGFKSSNDRPAIKIMKFIGFTDSSNTPTELWQRYRNKSEGPRVLAQALKKG